MPAIDKSGLQQPIEREINLIYNYLFDCATTQKPQIAIAEFNILFARGKNENAEVSQALDTIIAFPISNKEFEIFFSHCFYSIFNCWIIDSKSRSYTTELFQIIDAIANASSYDRRRKLLIKLVTDYRQSKAYLKLTAVVNIINSQAKKDTNNAASIRSQISEEISSMPKDGQRIDKYIDRYTFLYKYYCPQDLRLKQLNKFIHSLEDIYRQDFEIQLSKHIIYRFRLKQVAKMNLLSKGAGKVITKVDNPSLLSERAFRKALKQYLGRTNNKDLLERSQRFLVDNKIRSNYKIFKQDLYRFLIQDIKPRNSNYQFDLRLKNKIETIFPQSNEKPLNKTLILQTCRQLFSFLVIDPARIDLHNFANLIANLGTAQLMMILIKITLICPESKPDLEKKIFLIVNHYQLHSIKDVPWIIKTLEHLSIAFSIYFGKIDVSIAKASINKY